VRKEVLAILIVSLGLSLSCPFAGAEDAPDCDPDKGSCRKRIGAKEIILDITPKPVKAMEELEFHLVVSPDPSLTAGLTLDLSMPGMYMGKNQVLLRRSPDGTYTGKGVIPRCPSGRKLWRATLDIPKEGKVGFTFNVTR
jgi:hypothetical protein